MNNRDFLNPYVNPADPLSMSACGSGYCPSSLKFFQGIRQEHTLHYIVSGKGWYEINDKRYELGKGDIFAIFPDVLVKFCVNENESWLFYWVNFYGTKATEYCIKSGISPDNPVIHNADDSFCKILDQCLDIVIDKNCFYSQFQLTACLYNCLAVIENSTHTEIPKESTQKRYLSTAISYMEHHYWEQIQISSLAKYLGIEKSYLYRIFKKETGLSPIEYLIKLRIEKAKHLIRQGYSFHETASSVGIHDIFYFSKIFTKETGCSPSKFRASLDNRM